MRELGYKLLSYIGVFLIGVELGCIFNNKSQKINTEELDKANRIMVCIKDGRCIGY